MGDGGWGMGWMPDGEEGNLEGDEVEGNALFRQLML